MTSVSPLDYNETNKIGILLLDYIRVEAERDKIQKNFEESMEQMKIEYEEELLKINEEREKYLEEYIFIILIIYKG
jgi:hypothetical protein